MRITYESTIEEALEANIKLLEFSGQLKREKWKAFSYGVAIYCLVLYVIAPGPPIERLSIALPIALLIAAFVFIRYKQIRTKQLRKWLIQTLGTDNPIPSEYELNDEGIIYRRMGTTITFAWPMIQLIEDDGNSIVARVKPAGIAVIPKRIFESQEQMQSWKDFAENKMKETVQQQN